jgi:ubiquinone biosynthesis protein
LPPTSFRADAASVAGASVAFLGHLAGRVDRLVADAVRDARRVAFDSRSLFRAAAQAAANLEAAARGAPRLVRVLGELARIRAGYQLAHARAEAAGRSPEDAAAALGELHERNAERIYRLCVDLGGGVLKVGQFLSCRADLLPPAYVRALARLRDRVPPVPAAAIVDRIEAELEAAPEELFASFDPEPIATASLAQVHRAVLASGDEVAVKVRLPGIEERVAVDAASLGLAARVFSDALPAAGAELEKVAAELARAVAEELDFAGEADRIEEARAHLAGDPRVVVPRVYREFSAGAVLTMELVHGVPLAEHLDRGDDGGRAAVLGTLVDVLCAQVLRHGVFHGDPHPGNFLVCPDGRLALLDFGCVGRLDPAVRRAYARAALACAGGDRVALAAALAELGFDAGGDGDALIRCAELLLEAFRDRGALDRLAADPRAALAAGLEALRGAPTISVPRHFVLLGRVFGAVGGLLLEHRPAIDLPSILARHLSSSATSL